MMRPRRSSAFSTQSNCSVELVRVHLCTRDIGLKDLFYKVLQSKIEQTTIGHMYELKQQTALMLSPHSVTGLAVSFPPKGTLVRSRACALLPG